MATRTWGHGPTDPLAAAETLRPVAAGGWRRAAYGTGVGLLVGVTVGLLLSRGHTG